MNPKRQFGRPVMRFATDGVATLQPGRSAWDQTVPAANRAQRRALEHSKRLRVMAQRR